METKYPTLRRPQRKLSYFLEKESSAQRWTGKVTLQDIDKLFDDLDSASGGPDELLPVSPLLKTFSNPEEKKVESEPSPVPQKSHLNGKHSRSQMIPKGDVLQSAVKSVSPKPDIDMDSPFKEHGPVKTSSPIELNCAVDEQADKKDRTVSPLLFLSVDDEEEEELKTAPPPIQKPLQNGQITEKSGDTELESPPNMFAFSKSKTATNIKKIEPSCKETNPVTEKTVKKCLTTASEPPKKAPTQRNTDLPVSTVRQEPEHPAHEKKSECVSGKPPADKCSRVEKDMTSFLQKVRDAGQPKPACPKKSVSLEKVPTPPSEPDDDFLILEDDAPVWFSIPSRTAHSKSVSRQRQSKTSSTDEERPADKGTKDSQPEKVEKQQESVQKKSEQERQTLHQKRKKKNEKGGDSGIPASSTAQDNAVSMKATEPADDINEDGFCSQEDFPVADLVEEAKQNKKKRQQRSRIPSKERKAADKAEDQARDGSTSDSVKGKSPLKPEKKALKSSEARILKPIKDSKKSAKKTRVKSSKETTESIQDYNTVKETPSVEAPKEQNQEQSSEEDGDAVDLYSPKQPEEQNFSPVKETMKPEAQRKVTSKSRANRKAKQTRPLSSDEESLSDSQVVGKRKRNKPGEWWLSCTKTTEATEITDDPPVLKKSKQNHQKPRADAASPLKARKDGNLGERNQKQSELSPSQTVKQKVEKKKLKLNKKRTKKRESTEETTSTDNKFNAVMAEGVQDQEQPQQVLDQDLFDFPQRELSVASGDTVFHNTYHRAADAEVPRTAASVPPKRSQMEQVDTPLSGKQKRKHTRKRINEISEDVESISSQPQKLNPKNPKTHKSKGQQSKHLKSPALGAPKNGNVAVSPKPLGGAPEPLLKHKPLSAPKSVKRSLATFKDIFTSATATPIVSDRGDACQKSRHKILPLQEEHSEDTVQDPDAVTVTVVAAEPKEKQGRRSNHDILRDNRRYSDSTLKGLKSGPSSMIELEQCQEDGDCTPQSSRIIHPLLSESEFCAPPLRPLVLQEKDKANLTEWLRNLWPTTVDNGAEVTPDQFKWYFYQGRAMGFHVDLHCESLCNGKILLGSYMKKPLWVDHSATTVFNILTSCVSVTINGKESHFNPGQTFMVPHGHAYSIQNLTAEPAVLFFNRMLAGSPY